MNEAEKKYFFFPSLLFLGGSLILEIKATYPYQFGAFIALLPMAEHNTRSKTIDDAILRLT